MPEEKRYAIRCTTEEQARECREKGFESLYIDICTSNEMYIWQMERMYFLESNGYIIITYEEALSMGLLGKKKEPQNEEPQKELGIIENCVLTGALQTPDYRNFSKSLNKEQVKESPSENNLVEKIIMEIIVKTNPNEHKQDIIRKILKKHLSSK